MTSSPATLTVSTTSGDWVGHSETATTSNHTRFEIGHWTGETLLLSNNEEIRAVRITVTGDFEGISLDRTQPLQSLYTTIDCRYVEVVQPTETICIWVDEERLLNRSDPNFLATLLAAELGSFGQVLRGTVVVTGGGDGAGDTLPLSDQDLRLLETVVDRISGVGQKGSNTSQP